MLLQAHEYHAFFQAEGQDLDVNNGTVVKETVGYSGCNGDVGKDHVALGEGFVGGKDGRSLFITSGNELKEKAGPLDIHGKVTDLVNDEHPELGKDYQVVWQRVLQKGFFEQFNELVAVDVIGRESMLRSHQTESGRQVGLAHAGRAEEDDIFAILQETHGGQFINLVLVNGGLKREVKVVQGLLDRESGHLPLLFVGASAVGFGHFSKDVIENLHNVEFVRNSPFQVVVQDFQCVLHLEAFHVFREPVHSQLTHTAPRHTGSKLWISAGNQ